MRITSSVVKAGYADESHVCLVIHDRHGVWLRTRRVVRLFFLYTFGFVIKSHKQGKNDLEYYVDSSRELQLFKH